ncbi:Amidase [Dactylella cylindrospora]|nr:Amidase [Dactylella cylindrospora]
MAPPRKLSYINYPQPKEIEDTSPESKYQNPPASNPVISGVTLEILSSIVLNLGFLQRFFWNNAQFGELKKLKILENYPTPCFNTAVIPVESDDVARASDLEAVETPVDTTFYTSADYVKLYLSKKATPTQVATRLLEIIAQPPHQAAINQVVPELTLAAAEASTKRYETGTPLGPLDGVPIIVKDEVYIHGYETTFGSAKVFDKGEGDTAWCVKKLEEAGAIILAKSAMHELGSDTTNCNPVGGHTPRNPYNKNFYCGGSSGGSAYCVSAGLVPIAVGCDGGGSIRIPSNYCGIYGLKPSSGRVSGRPTPSLTPTNGVTGPMCATIEDLKVAYRIMAAPDPESTTSGMFPTLRDPLAPLTTTKKRSIGIWKEWFDDCDQAVHQHVLAAVQGLEKLGYEIVNLESIPYISMARRAHSVGIITDMSAFLNGNFEGINAPNRVLFSVAAQSPAIDIFAANRIRAMMMSHFAALWQKYPGMIIVNPVVPIVGAPIVESHLKYGVSDGDSSIRSMKYVSIGNFIGVPGINSVAGYDEATKLPISLMGMAEWGKEEDLLGWAAEVAKASGLERRKPENWVDALNVEAA